MSREYIASTTFTRPADTTAYTANDLVANSVTAGSVVPMSFTIPVPGISLERVQVSANSSTNTNAKFNLQLYSSSPTATNGDNGAWLTTSSNWLGTVAIDCTVSAFSDKLTGMGYANTVDTPVSLGSGTVYGLLQATAAYTPTSAEVFTVTLYGKVN